MKGAWRVAAWCAGGAAFSGAALLACVLADPPPLRQLPPPARPIVIGSSADPPIGVISTQPTDQAGIPFVVNVQIDPNQPLQWRVFRDYGTANAVLVHHDPGNVVGTGADGGTPVAFPIFALDLGDPTQCHTIEIDVATNGWVDTTSNVAVYPPGGDRAVWTYQPTGNCNVFDAGPIPPPQDASDGASE